MDQAIATRILKKIASRSTRLKLSKDQIFFTGMAAWPNDTPPRVRFVGFTTKEKHAKRNFGIEMAVDIAATLAKGIAPAPPVPDWSGTMSSLANTTGDTGSTMRNRGLAGAYQHGLKFIKPAGEDDAGQFASNRAFMSSQKWANNVGKYFILECYDTYVQCSKLWSSISTARLYRSKRELARPIDLPGLLMTGERSPRGLIKS